MWVQWVLLCWWQWWRFWVKAAVYPHVDQPGQWRWRVRSWIIFVFFFIFCWLLCCRQLLLVLSFFAFVAQVCSFTLHWWGFDAFSCRIAFILPPHFSRFSSPLPCSLRKPTRFPKSTTFHFWIWKIFTFEAGIFSSESENISPHLSCLDEHFEERMGYNFCLHLPDLPFQSITIT